VSAVVYPSPTEARAAAIRDFVRQYRILCGCRAEAIELRLENYTLLCARHDVPTLRRRRVA
jgi:hypothetical protein